MKRDVMIYLATPYGYTGKVPFVSKLVMWYRNHIVSKIAGQLMDEGYIVFSPITHSRVIAYKHKVSQLDHDYWLRQDKWFIENCDELWVLKQPGWESSVGVGKEIWWAYELGKPIVGIDKNFKITREEIYV